MTPVIELRAAPFDPWAEAARLCPPDGAVGANALFVGTMREIGEDRLVREMHLEFYPGMTEHQLVRIAAQAQDRWNLAFLGVLHRTGRVLPTEALVLVAARARHRGDAMDACREVIEALKHEAPFWKREISPQGTVRWVEGNSSGYLGR